MPIPLPRLASLLTLFALAPAALIARAPASELEGSDRENVLEDDLVATFGGDGSIDPSKTSRVLLVGDSYKLGALPLHAAITRAHRYAELHAEDQILLFVTKDVSEAKIAETGAELTSDDEQIGDVAVADLSALDASTLVDALDQLERIASIDFFGHSSPFGALVEHGITDRTLNADSPAELGELYDNFARDVDPYITLNGCNGGAETAPELSRLLELPVSGALTGTLFQTVGNDGRWYFDDPGYFPPGVNRATKNVASFEAGKPACWKGACTRLKPQDSPYRGVWADPATGFQYGLNHFKFFCDYDDPKLSCERGMAQAMYAWPSVRPIDDGSSAAEIADVLVDYFCSANADPAWFQQCSTGLRAAADANAGFSTMRSSRDYVLECGISGCEQELRCDVVGGLPQPQSCAWVAPECPEDASPASSSCKVKNTSKRTTVDEWHRFLAGHALAQEG